jgi:3-oxoacyl-[acyl-carrier-protein] synthase-3
VTYIKGCGHYLPTRKLSNLDLSRLVDTSDEWIVARTGIHERHIAAESQTTSDLAFEAAKNALAAAGIDASELQTIIVATATGEHIFPTVACLLQHKLGATNAFCFDISAACSGFVYAMTLANSLILTDQAQHVLVVGAEILSRVTDYSDRETCVLFGDGAGAVVVSKRDQPARIAFSSQLFSDGEGRDILKLNNERNLDPFAPSVAVAPSYIQMRGREVFKNAIRAMVDTSTGALGKAGIAAGEIDHFIPHQANERILTMVAQGLGIDTSRVVKTIHSTGNTSAASIPIALSQAVESKLIGRGQTILATAFGAGLTAGSIVFEY